MEAAEPGSLQDRAGFPSAARFLLVMAIMADTNESLHDPPALPLGGGGGADVDSVIGAGFGIGNGSGMGIGSGIDIVFRIDIGGGSGSGTGIGIGIGNESGIGGGSGVGVGIGVGNGVGIVIGTRLLFLLLFFFLRANSIFSSISSYRQLHSIPPWCLSRIVILSQHLSAYVNHPYTYGQGKSDPPNALWDCKDSKWSCTTVAYIFCMHTNVVHTTFRSTACRR
jgi:hypothetical protein